MTSSSQPTGAAGGNSRHRSDREGVGAAGGDLNSSQSSY